MSTVISPETGLHTVHLVSALHIYLRLAVPAVLAK